MTYLTDVKNDNQGPFEVVEDTHKFNFFNPFVYVMGSGLRIKNSYITKNFNNKIKSFLAMLDHHLLLIRELFIEAKQ